MLTRLVTAGLLCGTMLLSGCSGDESSPTPTTSTGGTGGSGATGAGGQATGAAGAGGTAGQGQGGVGASGAGGSGADGGGGSGGAPGDPCCGSIGPSGSDFAESGPITLTSGQTVTGLHITNPDGPCVSGSQVTDVVITNNRIGPCGPTSDGVGVSLYDVSAVTIDHNHFEDVASGFYVADSTT